MNFCVAQRSQEGGVVRANADGQSPPSQPKAGQSKSTVLPS